MLSNELVERNLKAFFLSVVTRRALYLVDECGIVFEIPWHPPCFRGSTPLKDVAFSGNAFDNVICKTFTVFCGKVLSF